MEEGGLRKERWAAVVGKAGKACFLRSGNRTLDLVMGRTFQVGRVPLELQETRGVRCHEKELH